MEVELENPWILLANKRMANIHDMVNCLNSTAATGRPILIIADDFADDILGTLIFNRMKSGFVSVAVKSPSYGDNRKAILDDIAILCGGRVVSDETGTKIENATIDSGIIGQAQRVIINKENTVIIGGSGNAAEINKRAESLRKQIEACDDEFTVEKLRERLAKLTSGIGIISVGATTESERKELRDRVDDAFAAAKAAFRGGIVAGGGTALLKARKFIINDPLPEGDYGLGYKILVDSLSKPIEMIIDNADLNSNIIVDKIYNSENINLGYDVLSKQEVDMIEEGIIDPAEVVINEIQNSASIAGLLLTTECLICEAPADKKNSNCSTCSSQNMPIM
jgi:chaperonin GroEL